MRKSFLLHPRITLIYWVSQLIGWGVFTFINILALISMNQATQPQIAYITLLGIQGLVYTHLFKTYIQHRHWLQLKLGKLISRVTIANVIIAMLMMAVAHGVRVYLGYESRIQPAILVPLFEFVNVFLTVLLWSSIYFTLHYFKSYEKTEIERLVWEAAVKDFELKTLKSQLNPHFMFNALNSIRALVAEDPGKSQSAITQLSNIFRYSLNADRTETVPLEDEIRTVVDYLSLEKIRYEERLRFEIDVDPVAKNNAIPPMMIQTLVENGIKHGISKIAAGGEIIVRVARKNDMLVISILNSGNFDRDEYLQTKGNGIANTKQRLHLLYGDKATFSINNTDNNFVRADITLPAGGVL